MEWVEGVVQSDTPLPEDLCAVVVHCRGRDIPHVAPQATLRRTDGSSVDFPSGDLRASRLDNWDSDASWDSGRTLRPDWVPQSCQASASRYPLPCGTQARWVGHVESGTLVFSAAPMGPLMRIGAALAMLWALEHLGLFLATPLAVYSLFRLTLFLIAQARAFERAS